MPWDFSTEPEFQAKLDWASEFVRKRVAPLTSCIPTDSSTHSTTNCDRSSTR